MMSSEGAQRSSEPRRDRAMPVKDVVVVYFSRLGGRLSAHQKIMLEADAKAIAVLKGCDFAGSYPPLGAGSARMFFVPDDALLLDEAWSLGINNPEDFYGGVVTHPFVKTKAITHQLVGAYAARPEGWSVAFADKVQDVVLPGYTAFCPDDARVAATRMLARGKLRVKRPLGASGRGQRIVTTIGDLDTFMEAISREDMATYGMVLEENLQDVTTISVGTITLAGLTMSYHGMQRTTQDNEGRLVYGGSHIVCVIGGWDALGGLTMAPGVRAAISQAKLFDLAMHEYPGFMASRRNYDVAQGLDSDDQRRSGVLESSWRVGGATSAELVALHAFMQDPALQVVEASHIEEYGKNLEAPKEAVVHIHGDDPRAGPMIRYTLLARTQRTVAPIHSS